jgi:hypothetical protein
MGTTTTPATGSSGMGMGSAQQMPASGSADMGSFNPRNYRTPTDCLNAASAAHVALSACGEHRGR